VQVAFITVVVGSISPTPATRCHQLSVSLRQGLYNQSTNHQSYFNVKQIVYASIVYNAKAAKC